MTYTNSRKLPKTKTRMRRSPRTYSHMVAEAVVEIGGSGVIQNLIADMQRDILLLHKELFKKKRNKNQAVPVAKMTLERSASRCYANVVPLLSAMLLPEGEYLLAIKKVLNIDPEPTSSQLENQSVDCNDKEFVTLLSNKPLGVSLKIHRDGPSSLVTSDGVEHPLTEMDYGAIDKALGDKPSNMQSSQVDKEADLQEDSRPVIRIYEPSGVITEIKNILSVSVFNDIEEVDGVDGTISRKPTGLKTYRIEAGQTKVSQ